MNEFNDFLLDYDNREKEELDRFLVKAKKGMIERYPPLARFINAREHLAGINIGLSMWGVIPFYGSTVIQLEPTNDRRSFDNLYRETGFTSKDLDRLIDFVKQTGRLQFVLTQRPTRYQSLEFLRPLFEELKPPIAPTSFAVLLKPKRVKQYFTEFDTLAG
ncbi:MAG: hypothetical protein WED04_09670 [Promethearchaeati archaeon SRVP18_Atabeyarchaeia-1]